MQDTPSPKDRLPRGERPEGSGEPQRPKMNASVLWLMIAVLLVGSLLLFRGQAGDRSVVTYSFFMEQVEQGNVAKLELQGLQGFGEFETPPLAPADEATDAAADGAPQVSPERLKKEFQVQLPPIVGEEQNALFLEKIPQYDGREVPDSASTLMIVWLVVTVLLFVGVWMMMRRTREQFMGGGLFSGFTKSPAKRYDTNAKRVTFKDVAGLEGVKADLQEVVEFLKNPERFQRLGGQVPKGVLLMGPPGTGKTLLARAVAGEAGVPFFSISGSEFIQMFVGVGASRVRDMFKTATDNAPSILFIDEIDAVGRQRGAGLGGGHDEREQTLNQILSEMDGFTPSQSVIVLAATNRPDVLDPALLRPGRFDRHVTVDRPSFKGRQEIFKVHMRNIPVSDKVDVERLAASTIGLTGADIRNLVNEAALWATRNGKDIVDMSDFEYARDKILMGAKREEVLSGKEKTMTAYHEAGHALLAWIVPGADAVHKVTIIPRGRALGVTQLLPHEERMNISESELYARLVFILGGRAAEKLVFHEYSAGAENDLKQGTRIARRMIIHWGMSERIGPVAYRSGEEHPFLGREIAQDQREYSEHTARLIDEEVARIMHEADERARSLLAEHRDKLDALAKALEEKEMLDAEEIALLIGPASNRARAASNGQAEKGATPTAPKTSAGEQ